MSQVEVAVAVTAEEIEAEIIRSRLEAEGIPARIAAKSQIGVPASWSPGGLGYGIGSFSVRVPAASERLARAILADVDGRRDEPTLTRAAPARSRKSIVLRSVATVVLIYLLIGMAYWLTQMLPELL